MQNSNVRRVLDTPKVRLYAQSSICLWRKSEMLPGNQLSLVHKLFLKDVRNQPTNQIRLLSFIPSGVQS